VTYTCVSPYTHAMAERLPVYEFVYRGSHMQQPLVLLWCNVKLQMYMVAQQVQFLQFTSINTIKVRLSPLTFSLIFAYF
jgi:hypothetical protein